MPKSSKPTGKIILLIALAAVAAAVLYLGPGEYLNLAFVQSILGEAIAYRQANPFTAALYYAALYAAVTAVSIPGAGILSLAAGAIFGFTVGTAIVVVGSTTGATIAFLIARYLFDDWVQNKMGERLAKIRAKFREEGALYLFSIRLVPAFPFFVVNLVMGLTSIRVQTYIVASLLGMLVPIMVFVNAGKQLGKLESLDGLLSPAIIASFLLLAVFPYIARAALKFIQARRKPAA